MFHGYFGRYGRPSLCRINLWRYNSRTGHPKKRRDIIPNPLLVHNPINEGLDHFLLACSASGVELGNGNVDLKRIAEDASYAALILNPIEHKNVLSLSYDYTRTMSQLVETHSAMKNENDSELRELLSDEMEEMKSELGDIEEEVTTILDHFSSHLDTQNHQKMDVEIIAGAGGASACVLVERLWDLYIEYFAHMGWVVDFENITYDYMQQVKSPSMIRFNAEGLNCIELFNAERGVHRIQEVPFNSERLQTNTVQVKVYPIIETAITKKLPREEFKWKLVRGSGKGGMKINTQPIQPHVIHIPTGISYTYFQSGDSSRDSWSNLEKAFEAVTRIVQERERQEHENKILGMIDQQKSSMERGERMRNYSYNSKVVIDYNVNKKIQLEDFFKNSSSHLELIGEEYTQIQHRKKVDALFIKLKKDLSVEHINIILSCIHSI